ncbi:MAG TPA: ABC transporter permease [Edaphobacter sp.]|nr:ABC transporter permease [Edaphobacter sp.]
MGRQKQLFGGMAEMAEKFPVDCSGGNNLSSTGVEKSNNGGIAMGDLRRDVAYSVRRLSRSPGMMFTVVVSIALGIAANATIFSMISRFVLRPAPVGDPGTLMALHTTHDGSQCCNSFSWPLYNDVKDQGHSFAGVAAYYELLPASIGGDGEPERIWGQSTTANFFDVAQLGMNLGRGFLPEEENAQVIVLSHRLWQNRFNSDPAIIGKPVTLSGRPFTVIGVAPSGFHGLDVILDPQFWIPQGNIEQLAASVPNRDSRTSHWFDVVGRLRPGVTSPQASAELNTLAKHLAQAYPASDKGNGFLIDRAGSLPPRDRATVLLFLGGLSVVVLLLLGIACANVANLLLAQSASRQGEMAVRIALGATRVQLLRQMLVESVLLALGGGLLGTLLSLWATSALSTFHIPAPVPLDVSVGVDWRVLLYTFALSVGTGLVFGFVPAWIASRPVLNRALKGEDALARPGRRITMRNVLVVLQIAMSIVLLCATGLFLRSLGSASSIDIGFRSHDLLMMSVDPRVHGYTPEKTAQFLAQLQERVAGMPGVVSAAVTDSVPLSGGHRSDGVHAEGQPKSGPDPIAELYMATPGYFETMGIPRLEGRDIGNESPDAPKVAIVNQALAEHLFGSSNPIGRRLTSWGATYEIIGVAKNIKSRTLGEDTRYVLFRSLAQNTGSDPSFTGYQLIVHTAGDSAAIANSVRGQIHDLDATMAVFNVETIQEHLRTALFLPRLAGTLFGIFGCIGLALAAVGLYGVMSYSVSRRTREIGIRIALGAQLDAVRGLVLGQGMRLTGIAMGIGLPAAWVGAKFSSSFLYGVHPHDTATFSTVPIFLGVVALVACWIPARRAAKVNIQSALHCE